MVGTGYGLEPDWKHGMYQGPDLVVQGVCYDLAKPEDRARMWGMIDSVAVFECTERGATVAGARPVRVLGRSARTPRPAWTADQRTAQLSHRATSAAQ